MWKILTRVNKNLTLVIPSMMIMGLCSGLLIGEEQITGIKALILPLTFLMVYPMMVTLNISHLKKGLEPKLQGVAQLINFGVIPFISFFLGRLFFPEEPYLAIGLLLAALLPTSGMTISWTGFAKGNMAAAINMTVIGLTLGSLATPFYVNWLMGTEVEVAFLKVIQQIAIIVFLPLIFGTVTRLYMVKKHSLPVFKEKFAPKFPLISTVGVLGIVFVAMALKADTIFSDPASLFKLFIPLLLLYLINFTLSTCVGKILFNREDAIALVYGTVMRNLSIALAIAINAFGEEGANAAMVIALAYVVQVQGAAWYVKFTSKIFGSPTA